MVMGHVPTKLMCTQIMMARSATKFRASTQDGSALQDHEINSRHRAARERDVLRTLFEDEEFPSISPEFKLAFILKFFKLDEGREAVKEFESFHEDLKLTIFCDQTTQHLFAARAMALQDEMDCSGNLPNGWKADLKVILEAMFVSFQWSASRIGFASINHGLDYI